MILALIFFLLFLGLGMKRLKPNPMKIYAVSGLTSFIVEEICALSLTAVLLALKCTRRLRRFYNPDREQRQLQWPHKQKRDETFTLSYFGTDSKGTTILLKVHQNSNQSHFNLALKTSDGRRFSIEQSTCNKAWRGDGQIAISGLRLFQIEPLQTYRILFGGLMRREDDESWVEVNLRLWIKTLADPSDFSIDFSPTNLARSIVTSTDGMKIMNMIFFDGLRFEQHAELRGRLQIGAKKFQDVCLFGLGHDERLRICDADGSTFKLQFRLNNGIGGSLNVETNHSEGFVVYQNGYVYPIVWNDFNIANFNETSKDFSINFRAHEKMFHLQANVIGSLDNSDVDGRRAIVQFIEVEVDDSKSGHGVVELHFANDKRLCRREPSMRVIDIPLSARTKPDPFTIPLHDNLCRDDTLTGGKAAQLADILAVTSSIREKPNFTVPQGFAITTTAFFAHIQQYPDLKEKIESLHHKASENKLTESDCEVFHEFFLEKPLTSQLECSIVQELRNVFGDGWETVYTAVRSSAVGEDGVEASGAGQMETFLGRRGLARITEAIKLCWASHFSFRAIEYRRQLCAKLDTPMAVVVQRLVRADVGGVLFTRHPDTGSKARSLINACYGIGEGVVSGHVQPDTISVYKTSPHGDDVTIVYDSLGEKASAYKLDEEKGEVTQQITTSSIEQCCLTEQEIRQIHKAGQFIESLFDNASGRDVEFALVKGQNGSPSQVLILQARPITTADNEEDWEMAIEFDSPVASEVEWVTCANLQEMMPGSLAPLPADNYMRVLCGAGEKNESFIFLKPKRRRFYSRGGLLSHQHVFLNMTVVGTGLADEGVKRSMDTSFFGRPMPQMKLEEFIEQNDMEGRVWWYRLMNTLNLMGLILGKNKIEKLSKKVDSYRISTSKAPLAVWNEIMGPIKQLAMDVWNEHILVTMDASILPFLLMCVLDKTLDWGPQIYSDAALMLSNSTNVFSADVPTQLEEISEMIRSSGETLGVVSNSDRSEAASWLLSTDSGVIGQRFRDFLAKHGHRCVRESDLRENSWRQEPEKVVDALKTAIEFPKPKTSSQKSSLSVEEAINGLKTPIGWAQRQILKILLPKARFLVGQRERTKSYAIKAVDIQRQAYNHLAKCLVEAGYLPDEDLVYFLVPHEIDQLFENETNRTKLVNKALKRRKFFPRFDDLKFPELCQSHPLPIEEEFEIPQGTTTISGLAVGQGSVEGRARVIRSLAEANQIQQGDILIVAFTDVGWTPYFPLISGLVTELGGIISHGAVVAREYGLPCLVSCKRATDIVETGDLVRIDGSAGKLIILSGNNEK